MNCHEIARLIDIGKHSALTSRERQEAEAHAHVCPHCAPQWLAHARLSLMSIPTMPAELAARCTILTAAGAQKPSSRPGSQGPTVVVGALVALAAAATMLLNRDAVAPQAPNVVSDSPSAATLAATPLEDGVAAEPVAPPQGTALPEEIAHPQTEFTVPQRAVPLFPIPLEADKAFAAQQNMALQKLVQLHPELVQGPKIDDMFVAAIVLRADGTVLSHALQVATRENLAKAKEELGKLIPADGGEPLLDFAGKGTQMPDGSVLRGDLSYHRLTVLDGYDPARSNLRVEQILRTERAALMLPAGKAVGGNFVTVLLSEDGRILHERVEFLGADDARTRVQVTAADRAKDMARRLEVDPDQIGVTGFVPVVDEGSRRAMFVEYAWQRGPRVSATVSRQDRISVFDAGVDFAAALAVVEHAMPDAFMGVEVEKALGQPVVVLTEEGVVLRTTRRKLGSDPDAQIRDLVPDQFIASAKSLTVTNSKGEKTTVLFIWQASPATREAMEKARKAASAR